MDVFLERSTIYALPPHRRVNALVYDGAADLRLWPGRGPDSDLREAWGAGLPEALDEIRLRLAGGQLELGSVVRVPPGRLHCDFLLWLATRPPEPGTERAPAPGVELLSQGVRVALEYAAQRYVSRIAFPALGPGPNELDAAERLAAIVRAARDYQEACFAAGRPAVIEEVLACEPNGAAVRLAEKRVDALVRASDPAPPSGRKQAQEGARRTKSGSGANRGRTRRKAQRGLDPDEIAQARRSAQPYDRRRSYGEGEWVDHPKFGVGRVERVTAEGAIVVRFEDGSERKMLHARG